MFRRLFAVITTRVQRAVVLGRRHPRRLAALLGLTLFAYCLYRLMLPTAYAHPFTAQSDLALLSEQGVLPRNINLKAFDPHRDAETFSCRMQAAQAPKLTPEAQALHEEAMTLTSPGLWPNERNWPRAMQLWRQAANQGHWKAALMWMQTARTGAGLDSEKGRFKVPPSPHEEVVKVTEWLMRERVADAFFWMGEFHQTGYGVKPNVDRAWAFWELAADLGSPMAQTQIALALPFVRRDQEAPKVPQWANQPLMYRLVECAHAQGYGRASYELGRNLAFDADVAHLRQPRFATARAQWDYALQVLHDGVKFGSEDAANHLFVAFDGGEPLVKDFIDKARAKRYSALGDALWNNPDLRFPNLDRVLPLPPAKLPPWNGDVDTLIQAAQAVRVTPRLPANPASQATGRAHVPEGHAVSIAPELQRYAERPILGYHGILSSSPMGIAHADVDGYYQPIHLWSTHPPERGIPHNPPERWRMELLEQMPPLRFEQGEPLHLGQIEPFAERGRTRSLRTAFRNEGDHELVYWHFRGQAAPVRPLVDHLARAGQVRALPHATETVCADGATCTQTGIWQPIVMNAEHPLVQVFNGTLAGESWRCQVFAKQGQALPALGARLASMLPEPQAKSLDLRWQLVVPCEPGFEAVET